MILFCELNPRLRREYRVVDFEKNMVNTFTQNMEYSAGGLINSLYIVKGLTTNFELLTYLGGAIGETIKNRLIENAIEPVFVRTKAQSLEEVVIRSRSLKTTVQSEYPTLTNDEEESLLSLFSENLKKAQIVVISEKPNNLDKSIYMSFFNLCYKNGIRVLVAPREIGDVIDTKPYLLSVDKDELEDYTKLVFKTQNQVLSAANIIFDKGIGVIVVNSQTGIMFITKSESYRVDFAEINYNIGRLNKDKLNSGIAIGLERGYGIKMTLKFAVAVAMLKGVTEDVSMADLKGIMNEIEVHSIKE